MCRPLFCFTSIHNCFLLGNFLNGAHLSKYEHGDDHMEIISCHKMYIKTEIPACLCQMLAW